MTDPLPITPLDRPVNAVVELPGSKSITNRALILAALAEGVSTLQGALDSDDTRYMAEALRRLGIPVEHAEHTGTLTVHGEGSRIPATSASLYIGNSGTSARFLTALVSLGSGEYRIDGNDRMRQRPITDLVDALCELGVEAHSDLGTGCPPVLVRANGLAGGRTHLRGDASSQYLSALLMIGPATRDGVTIDIVGDLVSRPYVEMTSAMMRRWGAQVQVEGSACRAEGSTPYRAMSYSIEPDASGASYFLAAAAVSGGRVRITGLGSESLQGDVAFVDVLRRMGCGVTCEREYIEVHGPDRLHGVDEDMRNIPDTVMTLAAIAPFADSPTTIRNVANIRIKETDRLHALSTELRKLGVHVEERADGLTVHPASTLHPAEIETYEDHRMAMSFAITGLCAPGIVIRDPACVAKTFPDFFDRLEKLST